MKRILCFSMLSLAVVTVSWAGDDLPAHGVVSTTDARRWEDAFVSGNGRMGALLFGNPTNDTFVANHCRLFLPLGDREIVPNLAQHVPELRYIIHGKGSGGSMSFSLADAKSQGYPDRSVYPARRWTKSGGGILTAAFQPSLAPAARLA